MNGWHRACAGAVLALAALPQAHGAEGFANCTGFIDALPATISTQGVWCLRKDLSTAQSSGNAVTVATNNVTIDCNDYKLGGLAAGNATQATGIRADNRVGLVVRRCNIRGFRNGIWFSDAGTSSAHLVEGNRLDGNTETGIRVLGDNLVVRDNWVRDTGGGAVPMPATAILAGRGEVVGNVVTGVAPAPGGNARAQGIVAGGGRVDDNRVGGLVPAGTFPPGSGSAVGIGLLGEAPATASGNDLSVAGLDQGVGIACAGSSPGATRGNVIGGFHWLAVAGCLSTNDELVP